MLSEDSKYAFVYLSSVLGDGDESEIKLASGRVMTAYNEAGLTAIEIDQKALVLAKALLNERNSELRILTQLFQSIGMKHKSEPLAA